ncbi:Palmitoyltransferase pfa5 [Fulvia fulva]|uniref:Palmitoyltransferase n=1 Tax=Passalora fulva TaxID=5499 RepID=A0A9Q8LJN6_PASFU|nr:Palmitoyltransferase pfa5 [Fulvia fulva]KAK4623606.1 Palmitoyltransferase pfa5 [Fulvia fulva]KAK4624823.1 Palmitoyltransferase pfa5 [Fulvia fulva]UJO17903.1 Palmitoyltransferase pfa5 [Fulvia fulva]WPV15478.1 Palmitoyltransferase pfa5 [Fulvia fulva]WPV30283.1 Palmitoyltransferase pfa5 [Fulvia fulva]
MSPRNRAPIWVSRFIPALLVLIVGYASWVVVGPLGINYLINPPKDQYGTLLHPQRVEAGLAISIVYFALLIPVAVTWLRLLLIVTRDPGYIPQGPEQERHSSEPQPGIEDFWRRDVFVCDPNGLPIWCAHCRNWKPDRTHHSQDVGRCTRKMDHFCPWVGGVVGERTLKFFIQFVFYTMILTGYLTVVLAYWVARQKGHVHWYVALGLAGFFLLFTLGMVMNSLNMVFQNITTIENVSRRMYLAVLLPPERQVDPTMPPPPAKVSPTADDDSDRPMTSHLDDPAHLNYFSRPSRSGNPMQPPDPAPPAKSKIWKGTITFPLHLPVDRPPLPAPQPRIFAILHTPPGLNPWNMGSAYTNFKQVFGDKLHEWVFPIKHSPCCDHTSQISEFPLGSEFELLLMDAGLVQRERPHRKDRRSSTSRGGKRKRRLDVGWQDGERPDGWVSEKEARRIRNEWRRRAEQGQQPLEVH